VGEVVVRPVGAEDRADWLSLRRHYCAALGETVADDVTEGVWRRILAADQPVWCLLAILPDGRPVGLANYVLHPHTWSLRTVCYLEDLVVAPEARGGGAGRALIDGLAALGRRHGWRRVYWHTHEDNYRARALYERVVPRTDYVRYDIDL
jgi:GNAT superfamily N-acetyltransferase